MAVVLLPSLALLFHHVTGSPLLWQIMHKILRVYEIWPCCRPGTGCKGACKSGKSGKSGKRKAVHTGAFPSERLSSQR